MRTTESSSDQGGAFDGDAGIELPMRALRRSAPSDAVVPEQEIPARPPSAIGAVSMDTTRHGERHDNEDCDQTGTGMVDAFPFEVPFVSVLWPDDRSRSFYKQGEFAV